MPQQPPPPPPSQNNRGILLRQGRPNRRFRRTRRKNNRAHFRDYHRLPPFRLPPSRQAMQQRVYHQPGKPSGSTATWDTTTGSLSGSTQMPWLTSDYITVDSRPKLVTSEPSSSRGSILMSTGKSKFEPPPPRGLV